MNDYTQNNNEQKQKQQNQNQNQNQNQKRTLFSVSIPGCLTVIILSAIAGIMVNECKRSKLRLENDRRKYQQNDTIARGPTAQNTLYIKHIARVH